MSAVEGCPLTVFLLQNLRLIRSVSVILDLSSMEEELAPIGNGKASKAEGENGTESQGPR